MNAALALALLLAAAAPAATTFDYSPASPSGSQIDDYLTRKHSQMAGFGDSFSNYGRTYNVDPRLVVSIAGAETTFGQHVCAEKNAWNWFYRRNCPQSPFASYEAGLERVTRFMRLSYINRGYDSIESIRYKYCATGCDNWVPLVTRFHDEMPYNTTTAPSGSPIAPAPAPASPGSPTSTRDAVRIFGLPPFVLFFAAALVVASWASRAFRR